MKQVCSYCFLFVSLFSIACNSSKKATRKYTSLHPITVNAQNNPIDIYRSSETRYWEIVHTRVALSFNLQQKTANGEVWIKLHPYWYATDSLVLDTKSMDIDTVYLIASHAKVLNYKERDNQLKIKFDQIFTKNESIQLYIKYVAKPYALATGGSSAISDDRGLYFINTDHEIPNKPVEIWTQGETESNSHWLPTIDHPNERFTVQVELTVPDSFKTLSNGELISREIAGKNMRKDVWKMDKPIQAYAVMFAIGNFSIVEDNPFYNVKVNYYIEPAFAPYAKSMFQHTPDMIAYFSEITGVPYPWNKYSQVVVRDYVSGAMENTSASLFGEFMNQNNREIADRNYEDIVSHELFHQWFGDYVTAESWSNITLNESFANYGEQIWRLHQYGQASKDELAYNDLNKYINQSRQNDEPLVRYHYADKEDLFDRISYEKGGAILNYLNGLIGDEGFHKAMNLYLSQNALHSAEVSNWRLAIEEVTGEDWHWFFNQWYFRGGHPALNINYETKNDQLIVSVVQSPSDSGLAYQLPLKAALIYGDKKEIIDWNIHTKRQSFSFPFKNGVKPVFVPDQKHWLPGVIQEHKKMEDWLVQFEHSDDYINKRKALATGFLAQKETITQTLFHQGLKDTIPGIRSYTLQLLEKMPDEYNWHKNFTNEVVFLALNDGDHKVRANAFDVLGKWKIEANKSDMIQAINDSSYMIAGAALNALYQIDKKEALEAAKKALQLSPKAELENAAWKVIATNAAAADINYFTRKANEVYGNSKMSLSGYLYVYCINTKNIDAFEQGLKTLTQLTKTENVKTYRFAVGEMVFVIYNYYKNLSAATNDRMKVNDLKEKLELIDKYKKQIMANETDPEILKKFEAL